MEYACERFIRICGEHFEWEGRSTLADSSSLSTMAATWNFMCHSELNRRSLSSLSQKIQMVKWVQTYPSRASVGDSPSRGLQWKQSTAPFRDFSNLQSANLRACATKYGRVIGMYGQDCTRLPRHIRKESEGVLRDYRRNGSCLRKNHVYSNLKSFAINV